MGTDEVENPPEENSCTPDQQRENQIKAIELNVESLKQYITLSTVSIAGLLAYYSSVKSSDNIYLFVSIGLFAACAVASVYNINLFINKVNKNNIDVRAEDARKANFFAIALFIFSIIFATIFFFNSGKDINKQESSSTIIFEKQGIEIRKTSNSKINISTDSIGNEIEILIEGGK